MFDALHGDQCSLRITNRNAANFKILALGIIFNPVQINRAFQMIELMLENPRNKAFQLDFHESALLIGVAFFIG
jgi:hypothetical protein